MDRDLHILLVDSSEATRKMVASLLCRSTPGLKFHSCDSATDALAILESGQPCDLVSTALALPDMNGVQFARRIRALPAHKWTPILVVSGDTRVGPQEEGFAAGITAYIDKAEGLKALVDMIQTYLKRVNQPVARVLYVEDSPTAAMAVRQRLEMDNLDVVHVMSAEEAQELLAKRGVGGERGFDILLTDILLKGRLTGTDLVRHVRHERGYDADALPALLITVAGSSQQEYDALLKSGANGIATKPIDEKEFLAQVNTLIMTRRRYEALHPATASPEARSA